MADSQLILELLFLHRRGGCCATFLPNDCGENQNQINKAITSCFYVVKHYVETSR